MKTKILLTILLAMTSLSINAQITFQKTYGGLASDWGRGVCLTNDGGYALCGNSLSFVTGFDDVYVIKTDSNGDTLWTHNYGLSGVDVGYSIRQTPDNGFIIAGSQGFGGFNGYLLKLDSIGNILWSSTAYNMNRYYSVEVTSDGNYIAIGYGGGSNSNIFLSKIDINGNLLWSKSYGSIYEDVGYSVKQTYDNGYILAGYTFGYGAGQYDAYLIKTDSIGNIIWTKTYGNNLNDYFFSVQQTIDSGFIACGGYNSPITWLSGGYAYLVKTDINGDTLWSKAFDTQGGSAYDVKQTVDSGYIFVGTGNSPGNVYLIKLNSFGNIVWSKNYGGNNSDRGYSIWQTNDKGFIIGGETESFGAGNVDYYLIKTDSLGNAGGCYEYNDIVVTSNPSSLINTGGTVGTGMSLTNLASSINTPPTIVNTLCSITNITQIQTNTLSMNIFPNPFSIQTTLQTNIFLKNAILTVYTTFGQQIKQIKNISGQTITLSRDNLSSGLYFIRLTQDNKTFTSDKLIITDY